MPDALKDATTRSTATLLTTLVAATAASYLVGYGVGSRWLLPVLNTAPAYGLMVWLLRRSERRRAVSAMLVWAASLGLFGTGFAFFFPERAEVVTLNGEGYREPMIHWLRTGEGEEGRPAEFLPRHGRELLTYVPIALATAGAGAMLMGAVLMNFMDFFVAGAACVSSRPLTTAILAWFPWSVVRVVGYVVLGVILAEPMLHRVGGSGSPRPAFAWRWLIFAGGCLVADVLIKASLAPWWGRMVGSYLE